MSKQIKKLPVLTLIFTVVATLVLVGMVPIQSAQAFSPIVISENNFDDNTTQGWSPRGDGVAIAATAEIRQAGTHSLLVTGRTSGWHGALLDVLPLLKVGGEYTFVAYARLRAVPSASTDLVMTMERRPQGGETGWSRVAAQAVTDRSWVRLEGTFTLETAMEQLVVYIECSDVDAEFFVDTFSITMTKPYTGWRAAAAPRPPAAPPAAPRPPAAPPVAPPTVLLNGNRLTFDTPPVVTDGRVLVPMRTIFEALGARVAWSAPTITATRGADVIILTMGSRTVSVRGRNETIDVAPGIVGGRTLVPLRFVSQALGAQVAWDPAKREVTITSAR